MRIKYICLCLSVFLVGILVPTLGFSQGSALPSYDVAEENKALDSFKVYFVTDDTNQLDVEDIASWKVDGVLTSSRVYTKYKSVNYWLCFTLNNQSQTKITRIVSLDEPYYDEVDLFFRSEGVAYRESAGLRVPLKSRSVHNQNPIFLVKLDPGQSATIYIRLRSEYGMLIAGCYVDSVSTFIERSQIATAWTFIYFGFLLAIVLYNMFLFLLLREKVYAYYILHGVFFAVFVSIHMGIDLYTGISPIWHYRLTAAISLVLVFIVLFSRELLQTKKNIPKIDKMLVAITTMAFIVGIASAINISYYPILTVVALPSYLFLLFVGIYAWFKRIDLAQYYVLSMSLYFLGIVLLSLLFLGIIPYNAITRNAYLLGSMAELTIFSLALGHRLKLLQRQNLVYQQQLLSAERENKERLEAEVAVQTAELRRANIELDRLARHDGLTGLANRRFLDECLHNAWQRMKHDNKPISVIMCDIDYFKAFNDCYGHQQGDECLMLVAKVIQSNLQRPLDLAARYGGEEFLILLPDTDVEGAMHVATAIKTALSEAAMEHAKSMVSNVVTMSYGVASMVPTVELSSESLVSCADKALYDAKNAGRDRICLAE